ncbi:Chromosome partition protein Smc [Stieleria varia]|uniref:Chromosome partition protein Smc n=2 Tax=Stieleria varia TaxID=2528005 RepID=A0A5C6AP01_9BACT|nr:Chromosome partition protein Smc [Stieleria varia]
MDQLQAFADRGAIHANVAIGSGEDNWRSASEIPGLVFSDDDPSVGHKQAKVVNAPVNGHGPQSSRTGGAVKANADALMLQAQQTRQRAEADSKKILQQAEQRRLEVEELRNRLTAEQAALEGRAATLEQRASELQQQENALQQRSCELNELKVSLQHEKAALEEKLKAFKASTDGMDERKKDLAGRAEAVRVGEQEMQARSSQLATRQRELEGLEQRLDQREREMMRQQTELENSQRALAERESQLETLENETQLRSDHLVAREEEVKRREDQLDDMALMGIDEEELKEILAKRDAEMMAREQVLLKQIATLRQRQESVFSEKQALLLSMANREEELARRERELLDRESDFVRRGTGSVSGSTHSSSYLSAQIKTPLDQSILGQPSIGANQYDVPVVDVRSALPPTVVVRTDERSGRSNRQPIGSDSSASFAVSHHSADTRATQQFNADSRAVDQRGVGQPSEDTSRLLWKHRMREFESRFGPCSMVEPPLQDDRMKIDVLVFPPHEERDFTTLATNGMSDYPVAMPHGQRSVLGELLLYVTHVDHNSIALLRSAAMLPYIRKNGLTFGSTTSLADIPGSGVEGSALDNCVYMLPVIDNDSKPMPGLRSGANSIQPFWLVPITSAERKLIDFSGIHKFLPLLEKHHHPIYYDATRECYVKRKGWFRR